MIRRMHQVFQELTGPYFVLADILFLFTKGTVIRMPTF